MVNRNRGQKGQALIGSVLLSILLAILFAAIIAVSLHVAVWGAYKESTSAVAECAAEVLSKLRWYHGMVRPDNGPSANGSLEAHAAAIANSLGSALGLPEADISFTQQSAGDQILTVAHCNFSNLKFPGTNVPTLCFVSEDGVSGAHSAGPMGLVNIEVPIPVPPNAPPQFRGVQCPCFFAYTTGGLPSNGSYAVIRDQVGGASKSSFNLELGMYLSGITSPGSAAGIQRFRTSNSNSTVFSQVPYQQGQCHGFLHDTTSFPLVQ